MRVVVGSHVLAKGAVNVRSPEPRNCTEPDSQQADRQDGIHRGWSVYLSVCALGGGLLCADLVGAIRVEIHPANDHASYL